MSAGTEKYLHDLEIVLAAPTLVLSSPHGDVRARDPQGIWHADVRVLSRAEVRVGGERPIPLAHGGAAAGTATFVSMLPGLDRGAHDPTVTLERRRDVRPGCVDERLTLRCSGTHPGRTQVTVTVASDLAPVATVRRGQATATVVPQVDGATLTWQGHDLTARLSAPGATVEAVDDGAAVLTFAMDLPAYGSVTVAWSLAATDAGTGMRAAPAAPSWQEPSVRADDERLAALVRRSLTDLDSLRLTPTGDARDIFLAAGAPWYLTLFGRDGIWAARMLLPVGTDVAASTLRLLASHQGRSLDVDRAEAPGKILHELRRGSTDLGDLHLPPLYYGSVDSTPLWIALLHDAWRWGLADDVVRDLLPALEAALAWLRDHADHDGDGFLEYVDESGRGLANQGWKDSGDAVRFSDGRRASPPIALCEVQGYAHEAAVAGAALLDAFDRPGADEWRAWAASMAQRFRAAFWVGTGDDRFPALALDGTKTPVDAVTSNIGHLLGTGLLDAAESATLARRVTADDLDGGLGLRTMSCRDAGYAPLSYHCGSVWPHDTAIVLHGLLRAGHGNDGRGLVAGLLAAAEAFDYRLPELWSGDPATAAATPRPYPAACRPQAWSAAAALVLLQAVLGLQVDVPGGVIAVRPMRPSPVGALRVEGLRVGPETVTVEITAEGDVVEVSGTALRVDLP